MPTKFENLGARMIRDLMRDFPGLKDFQAAAVPGNGGGESGGFTLAFEQSPTVAGSKGGSGYFQWTGMTPNNPRRRNWEGWLRAHGKDPNNPEHVLDYDMNYGFLKHELETSEKATIPALKKAKDEVDATRIFMVKFERPGKPHFEGRVRWTKQALGAFRKDTAWNTDDALRKAEKPNKTDAKAGGGAVAAPVIVGGSLWAFLKGMSVGEWAITVGVILVLLGLIYWFIFKPILRRLADLRPTFASVGSDQLSLWSRIRLTLKGMKSYLWGRLLAITGTALPMLQGGGFIDVTQFLPAIHAFGQQIEAYVYLPIVTYGLAWVNNKLAETRDTTPEELASKLSDGKIDTVAEEAAPHLPKKVRVSQTKKRKRKAA